MKKILFVLLLVLANMQLKAQSDNLYYYIKIWGFLKYYHPSIARGGFDVDSFFVKRLPGAAATKDNAAFNKEMKEMITSLGTVPPGNIKQDMLFKPFTRNLDNGWLQKAPLDKELQQSLRYIEENRFQGSQHRYIFSDYGGDTDEPIFSNISYPMPNYQLLALARFWNIIQYVFPYKYLISQNWDDVLRKRIPGIRDAATQVDYEKELIQLIAAVDDSHASNFQIKRGIPVFGEYFPGFAYRFIKDSIVVTSVFADSVNDIRKGDVIVQINNMSVAAACKQKEGFMPASNMARKKLLYSNPLYSLPFRGKDSICEIKIWRKGTVLKKRIALIKINQSFREKVKPALEQYYKETGSAPSDYVFKSAAKGIGMIAAMSISKLYEADNTETKVDSVLKMVREHEQGLIIDLRQYCLQNVIFNKVLPALGYKPKWFADYYSPNIKYPGTLINTHVKNRMATFSRLADPTNKEPYKGKIVLLVNEKSQSQSEWVTMILQAAMKVTVMGSQTAGADGDIFHFQLPGDYQGTLTGRRVSYPDGTESQRSGVKIDIIQYPTTAGLTAGRDELMEKAIEFIKK
ncbi:hypothetical protein GFS24_15625 [Chitinophaga sp. SYP-B3965]|uniref:S41 family peptidase n=1 Tax=Chitinophaga sp. SYP-B3965 TaxID=2663120 RepID=UPI0012998BB1|nr:S41 family peptidase [Chitinophaga sp. SYP-B3965]MRG46552.1 hypothetical protein [Chitinophaga sp. SYP-B3965]